MTKLSANQIPYIQFYSPIKTQLGKILTNEKLETNYACVCAQERKSLNVKTSVGISSKRFYTSTNFQQDNFPMCLSRALAVTSVRTSDCSSQMKIKLKVTDDVGEREECLFH